MKVSVIIPSYNAERFIERSIRSVSKQSHSDMELIVIDNCSTDKSVEVIQSVLKDLRFPSHLLIEERKGASFARNRGLKEARGEWVQFLDSDDELIEGKIERQLSLVDTKEEVSIVAGAYKRKTANEANVVSVVEDPWEGLIKGKLGCTVSNLFRRKELESAGGWDEGLKSSQEYYLMFRMLKDGSRVICDQEPNTIVHVRDDGHSISSSDLSGNWIRNVNLRVAIRDYLRTSNFDGKEGLLKSCNQQIFDALRTLAGYDFKKALELHHEYVRGQFAPGISPATSTSYLRLYRLLGFSGAEKIKRFIGR